MKKEFYALLLLLQYYVPYWKFVVAAGICSNFTKRLDRMKAKIFTNKVKHDNNIVSQKVAWLVNVSSVDWVIIIIEDDIKPITYWCSLSSYAKFFIQQWF